MDYAYFIGLIMALDELFKRLGLNARLLPVINIILGIALAFTIDTDWRFALIKGLEMGLIASGLYSSTKNTIQYFKK